MRILITGEQAKLLYIGLKRYRKIENGAKLLETIIREWYLQLPEGKILIDTEEAWIEVKEKCKK